MQDKLLGHGDDNDGIEEYDNNLPTWWQVLLLVTVVWAFGYALDYHFISDRSQAKAYETEMALAAEQWPQLDGPISAEITPEAVAAGEALFKTNCVACHGADLTGGIGPNLVDAEWIHGGSLDEIVKTINVGVPEKGMITWGPILGPEKVAQVAAYVYRQSHPE